LGFGRSAVDDAVSGHVNDQVLTTTVGINRLSLGWKTYEEKLEKTRQVRETIRKKIEGWLIELES
jgi:hypothetical protein